MKNSTGRDVNAWLEAHGPQLVAFRRHLHAHPEPSGFEYETTAAIAAQLRVASLEHRVWACGTGLVCDIGTGDGPLVALRADIDALEMPDEKDVAYKSTRAGIAHACGHDVHTTVVLGAGLYLAAVAAEHGGRVRLIFQPAEERVPGGALDVIADGGLDGVSAVVGVHCEPKLDVGTIGLRSGAITSAADMVDIELHGPGGHTARPELTVDMVSVVAKVIAEVPKALEAQLGGLGPTKCVFGAVHAGDAANVIPTTAHIRGTVRTQSMEAWDILPSAFDKALQTVLEDSDVEISLSYTHGVPPAINDASVTAAVREGAIEHFADDAVTEANQSWGGDDFAWFTRERPGTYVRLGTHNPDGGHPHHDLHVGHFDVDERVIDVGVRLLSASVLQLWDQPTA